MAGKIKLINVSVIEFTRRLFRSGGISFKGFLLLFVYYFQLIPSVFFEFLQFLIFGSRIKKTRLLKDPVFILGHYRSGTSYLQKLLASDKRFGYLTYYDALFPNTNLILGEKIRGVFQWIIRIFKIKNPFFHNSILQLTEPDEEDDYLMNKASAYAAYWGLIYPKKWYEWLNGSYFLSDSRYTKGWKKEYLKTLKYLTYKNTGKQLILKSPPNTERIELLMQLFPNAKFISIRRNPYHLYYSIKNMWQNIILKYYSLQHISDGELDDIIFGHFSYLTDKYESDKHLIPESNLVEISYEELKAEPFAAVQKIYTQLQLPDFGLTKDNLMIQLDSEKTYREFHYTRNEKDVQKISERWGKYIRKWNYKMP